MTPFGNMHVKIVVDPASKREREIFAQLGKGGDLANSDLEAICRLSSLYLRVGGSLETCSRNWRDRLESFDPDQGRPDHVLGGWSGEGDREIPA